MRFIIYPFKAYTPLKVDPYAKLSPSNATQCLKIVFPNGCLGTVCYREFERLQAVKNIVHHVCMKVRYASGIGAPFSLMSVLALAFGPGEGGNANRKQGDKGRHRPAQGRDKKNDHEKQTGLWSFACKISYSIRIF